MQLLYSQGHLSEIYVWIVLARNVTFIFLGHIELMKRPIIFQASLFILHPSKIFDVFTFFFSKLV